MHLKLHMLVQLELQVRHELDDLRDFLLDQSCLYVLDTCRRILECGACHIGIVWLRRFFEFLDIFVGHQFEPIIRLHHWQILEIRPLSNLHYVNVIGMDLTQQDRVIHYSKAFGD